VTASKFLRSLDGSGHIDEGGKLGRMQVISFGMTNRCLHVFVSTNSPRFSEILSSSLVYLQVRQIVALMFTLVVNLFIAGRQVMKILKSYPPKFSLANVGMEPKTFALLLILARRSNQLS
ncbi:hypothetical protein K443DRAFT_105249, partial [Laccaria amethystina LaAM-08-1]